MIGYYVHHVGSGHLQRARAVAEVAHAPVTGLSSLPRPAGWSGEWVVLDRDDEGGAPVDPTAGGHLHWVPQQDRGLRSRMARVSRWIDDACPAVLVSDVSVEMTMLARLHGVPVVSFVLPGHRTDAAHLLGFGASAALVGCWPEEVRGMTPGLPDGLAARITRVGALSRFPVGEPVVGSRGRRVTVLLGRGGGQPTSTELATAQAQTPDWEWAVLGPGHTWTDDVAGQLEASDVVVTQAGESAVAEVAACRRPALVIPAERPHDEQRTTAEVLAGGSWPVLVEPRFPLSGWAERLEAVSRLDGTRWAGWCDGKAASRIADVLDVVAVGGRA
jgi:hypothetical protein